MTEEVASQLSVKAHPERYRYFETGTANMNTSTVFAPYGHRNVQRRFDNETNR